MKNKYMLVIHGGAGTILKKNMSNELEEKYRQKLRDALKAGYEVLKGGGSSIDAVETAITVLENSPLFNAGKGAVFTSEGKNEMDASIMDGKNLNAGAVAAVTRVKNPIMAARKVMEESPHVMLSGRGANTFADNQGLELVDQDYFKTEKRWKQYQKIKNTEKQQLDHSGEEEDGQGQIMEKLENNKFGTVGAVALDKEGNLAAGTSTGGMTNKRFGRIGDSPIIGAGTYAKNSTCAVSCTGHGEYFIRQTAAFQISALMEFSGLSLKEAAHQVIMRTLKEMGGAGGVIAVDDEGNITMPFNTPGMYRGYVNPDGEIKVALYGDEKITK